MKSTMNNCGALSPYSVRAVLETPQFFTQKIKKPAFYGGFLLFSGLFFGIIL